MSGAREPSARTLGRLYETARSEQPVFAAPWEARVFSLAVQLSEAGLFSWREWSSALGREKQRARDHSGADEYRCWLAALETLVVDKQLLSAAALRQRKKAVRSGAQHPARPPRNSERPSD